MTSLATSPNWSVESPRLELDGLRVALIHRVAQGDRHLLVVSKRAVQYASFSKLAIASIAGNLQGSSGQAPSLDRSVARTRTAAKQSMEPLRRFELLAAVDGGRQWTRTTDLLRVEQVL